MTPTPTRPHAAAEVAAGVRTAVQGLRGWAREPRLLALGALPGVIVAAGLGIALGVLALNLSTIGSGLADAFGFEDGWAHGLVAATAAAAVMGAAALVSVALFTALTLAIGQPFFEAISRRVDATLGYEGEEVEEAWTAAVARGLREGAVTVGISLGLSIGLLVVGLVPLVGSVAAFACGALLGGRLLAIELTAYPMARRGIVARRDRIAALRPHRPRVIAFGTTVFLVFLLPLGALLAMPTAVVGATLLVRDCRDR
ncbi:EI24 domain-containing protein [Demequina gelatinilytica]|uniref:EI24 domain-containing protein n=1 Tax=Demequina gelatinilytica TaxID=1638980 RepID=UPI0007838FAA|nr:EI24 domain-containing protein [Demequina gelatinilytica]